MNETPPRVGPLKNVRRERYAQERFRGRTEFVAFVKAGYTGDKNKKACKIEAIPEVQARIRELSGRVERRNVMQKGEALEMLSTAARASFAFFKKAGRVTARGIEIKTSELDKDPDLKAAVKEFVLSQDGDRVTVKLHAFDELIGRLARLEGWESPRKIDIARRSLEDMTDAELLALDPDAKAGADGPP